MYIPVIYCLLCLLCEINSKGRGLNKIYCVPSSCPILLGAFVVVIIFVVGCTATYAIGAIMTNIVNLNPALTWRGVLNTT